MFPFAHGDFCNFPSMEQPIKQRSFFQNFSLGTTTYFEAFGFIFKHNLWYYLFYPVGLSVMLFFATYYGAKIFRDWLTTQVMGWLGESSVAGDDLISGAWNTIVAWLTGAAEVIIGVVVGMFVGFVFYRFQKYIILILLSPVLAFLSEKTEKVLTGNDYPFNMDQFVRDIWRGILIALRNMLIEFAFIIGCFILTFFLPILIPFSMLFLFGLGAYFYGFSMIDYASERRRLGISASVRFIRAHKGVAIANGGLFQVMLWIPYVGFVFAPIVGVVAATIATHKIVDLGTNQYAQHAAPQVSPRES